MERYTLDSHKHFNFYFIEILDQQDKPYMCTMCEEFFKTKLEMQQHSAQICTKGGSLSQDQIMQESVS